MLFLKLFVLYFFDHPLTYTWHRQDVGAFQFVFDTFINSAGLLIVSIVFAAVVGVLLGMAAALSKGRVRFCPGIDVFGVWHVHPEFFVCHVVVDFLIFRLSNTNWD